jgi:hypothetical protein
MNEEGEIIEQANPPEDNAPDFGPEIGGEVEIGFEEEHADVIAPHLSA